MLEGAPQAGRDGAGAAADVEHPAVRGVPHHHPRRVAGQPPGRFRGNVGAVCEPGRTALAALAVLTAGRQHLGIHVHHHLITVAATAGIEARGEGALGHQAKGIGAALLRGSRLCHRLCGGSRLAAAWPVERLDAGVQGAQQRAPVSGARRAVTTTMPSSSV
jgi:hypothetical protein